MRRVRISIVVGLLVFVGLAGCVAQEQVQPSAAIAGPAAGGLGDDATGIQGLVTDDALTPLGDVQLGLLDTSPALSVVTDSSGAYRFVGLAPGTYKLAAQKLGYESAVRIVQVESGKMLEVNVALPPLPVHMTAYYVLLIGEGYFACGADTPVVTWGNLHACVWDEHKPRYSFEAPKPDLMGIMQEVAWRQSSALTSQTLKVYLQYKPVCDPFCSSEKEYASATGPSPVRIYTDFQDEAPKFKEDPIPLSSMTFPDRNGQPVVIVFQQRMTHYITLFYGEHGNPDSYTAVPDD